MTMSFLYKSERFNQVRIAVEYQSDKERRPGTMQGTCNGGVGGDRPNRVKLQRQHWLLPSNEPLHGGRI